MVHYTTHIDIKLHVGLAINVTQLQYGNTQSVELGPLFHNAAYKHSVASSSIDR